MTEKTGLDDVEATLWRWSGWKADQRSVDAVLEVVERHVRSKVEAARAVGARQPSVTLVGAQRAAEDLLAQARNEAAQIVQSARDEAAALQGPVQKSPERPAEGLKSAPWIAAVLTPYQGSDGTVWLRIGSNLNIATSDGESRRRCTRCEGTKPITRFSRDPKGRNGRRLICKDCENAGRRDREARKRQQRDSVTTGVRE